MNVTLVEWDQYPSNFPRSNITGAGHYGRLDCYRRSLLKFQRRLDATSEPGFLSNERSLGPSPEVVEVVRNVAGCVY
jgi:hypothetical protein